MRLGHTLFVVSALLFVCGVGFVVLAARAPRGAASPVDAPLAPVASVRHIMRGMVDPAATRVFGAVSTTVTTAGWRRR